MMSVHDALWALTNALENVRPTYLIVASAAMYLAAFLLLRMVIMPLFPVWRKQKEIHRIEWIMRMIATFNGTICGFTGLYCILYYQPTSNLAHFRLSHYLCAGYFVYDTLGNVFYFHLLHKRYILFHHLFCFLVEVITVFNHLDYFCTVCFFGLIPDPIDHVMWFLKRMELFAPVRRLVEKVNTYFFIVNRLLISNYYIILAWRFEPASSLEMNFAPTLFTYFCFSVYFGMNMMVSSQRLKPKRHPAKAEDTVEELARYPYNVPSSPAPSRVSKQTKVQ